MSPRELVAMLLGAIIGAIVGSVCDSHTRRARGHAGSAPVRYTLEPTQRGPGGEHAWVINVKPGDSVIVQADAARPTS